MGGKVSISVKVRVRLLEVCKKEEVSFQLYQVNHTKGIGCFVLLPGGFQWKVNAIMTEGELDILAYLLYGYKQMKTEAFGETFYYLLIKDIDIYLTNYLSYISYCPHNRKAETFSLTKKHGNIQNFWRVFQ